MYRKFTADYIFNGYEILSAPSVLITDRSGVIIDLVNTKEAGDGIEELNGIICPGFVNAHCHLELSHLKGRIPENTGLVDFVQQVMTGRSKGNEQQFEAMEEADRKMYQSGIVAVGDICNSMDSILLTPTSVVSKKARWILSGQPNGANVNLNFTLRNQSRQIVTNSATDKGFHPNIVFELH